MSILIITAVGFLATTPPWAREVERQTPWGQNSSQERKEKRENFFEGLSFFDRSQEKSKTPKIKVKEIKEESFVEGELDGLEDLPWRDYEKSVSHRAFPPNLVWPVEGGALVSGYGIRRGRVHEGLDISGERGDMVRAVAPGRVTYSGHMRGYGRILVLAHGNDMASIYAHNMAHLVKEGDFVEAGQPIAHLGQSGNASGYHLHFEIRRAGKAMNPLEFKYSGSPLVASRSSKD